MSLQQEATPRLGPVGDWTDERIALMKKLLADGRSCSQIAAELGNVTRNGVIGKIHRLKLTGDKPSKRNARADKDRSTTQRIAKTLMRSPSNGGLRTVELAIREELPPLPNMRHLTFEQLDLRRECHWPRGEDADMRFCGLPIKTKPYCAHHRAIAYPPPQPRRA